MDSNTNAKRVYGIYTDVLGLHRKYIQHIGVKQRQAEFMADVNRVNAKHNSMFCSALTDALRQCFVGWCLGVEEEKLTELYTDLWRLHKTFMDQERSDEFWDAVIREAVKIDKKYTNNGYVVRCLTAIADALDGWL